MSVEPQNIWSSTDRLKGEIEKSTVIVIDPNTHTSVIDKITKKKSVKAWMIWIPILTT